VFNLIPVTLLMGVIVLWTTSYDYVWRVERLRAGTAPEGGAAIYGRRHTVSVAHGQVYFTVDVSAPHSASPVTLGPAEYKPSYDKLSAVPEGKSVAARVTPGFPGAGVYGGAMSGKKSEGLGFMFARFGSGPRSAQEAESFGARRPPRHEQRTYAVPFWAVTILLAWASFMVLIRLVIKHRPTRRLQDNRCKSCGHKMQPTDDRCLVCSEPARWSASSAIVR
jgi:hypothetical protein